MIRYRVTMAQLQQQVDALKPTWRARAAALTLQFEAAGQFLDGPAKIWSEVKDVFIELQQHKCAFCERELDSKKEYDVEHFRPKAAVKRWPVSSSLEAAGVQVNQPSTAKDKESGYYQQQASDPLQSSCPCDRQDGVCFSRTE